MNKIFSIAAVLIVSLLFSCGNKYKLELNTPKKISIDQPLNITVKEKNNNPIDSIQYFINGKVISNNESIDISDYKLGKQSVSATAFYQDEQRTLNNTIYFLAKNPPTIYNYEIINEYPHDKNAFTQGFEFYNGFFYESTGNYGKSSLRKVDIKSGEILQKIDIDKQYFAEGLTIFNNKIYQLTWKKNKGFVYDLETFKLEKTFNYYQSKEGWGLTHDNEKMIKSDGTERMWFLNSETLKEEGFIEAYTNKRKAELLNELEYVNGKIYANVWQKNAILIINPLTGAMEGVVDLKGLQSKAGQTGDDNVLNGIAYDKENDRLFVTGKKWSKVFEIKLVKK